MRLFLLFTILLSLGTTAYAQGPVPKGKAPQIGLASAVEKDGKVVVEVFELREVARIKMEKVGDVFIEMRHWLSLTTGVLGKDMRAYKPDGKLATPQEVLKALAKPSGVVYFVGFSKDKPVQPDPFYLSLLKEGSVALAFDRPQLAPPMTPSGVMP